MMLLGIFITFLLYDFELLYVNNTLIIQLVAAICDFNKRFIYLSISIYLYIQKFGGHERSARSIRVLALCYCCKNTSDPTVTRKNIL